MQHLCSGGQVTRYCRDPEQSSCVNHCKQRAAVRILPLAAIFSPSPRLKTQGRFRLDARTSCQHSGKRSKSTGRDCSSDKRPAAPMEVEFSPAPARGVICEPILQPSSPLQCFFLRHVVSSQLFSSFRSGEGRARCHLVVTLPSSRPPASCWPVKRGHVALLEPRGGGRLPAPGIWLGFILMGSS